MAIFSKDFLILISCLLFIKLKIWLRNWWCRLIQLTPIVVYARLWILRTNFKLKSILFLSFIIFASLCILFGIFLGITITVKLPLILWYLLFYRPLNLWRLIFFFIVEFTLIYYLFSGRFIDELILSFNWFYSIVFVNYLLILFTDDLLFLGGFFLWYNWQLWSFMIKLNHLVYFILMLTWFR